MAFCIHVVRVYPPSISESKSSHHSKLRRPMLAYTRDIRRRCILKHIAPRSFYSFRNTNVEEEFRVLKEIEAEAY